MAGEMHEMKGTHLGSRAGLWAERVEWSRSDDDLYMYHTRVFLQNQSLRAQSTGTGYAGAHWPARLGGLTNHPKARYGTVACRMSTCSSTPHPVPRSRQAGNAGQQMGASLPACLPGGEGGLTDEGRPDESRRSWLPRHSNPMLSGAAHRPASWNQGACGLGSGSRWAGLGWAKVVAGRQRSLDTTTLQAGPHPRRRLRLPAWSTMSCSTSGIVPAAAKMEGARQEDWDWDRDWD